MYLYAYILNMSKYCISPILEVQPESWLRIRKLEARVPQILIFKCSQISTTIGRGSLKFLEHS